MSSANRFLPVFVYTNLFIILSASNGEATKLVPAVYVLGDSLVDVGNNNHLVFSLSRADFPHNGIDFLNKKATGRFSNGKNAADFIAEKVGLPTSPPYLAVKNNNASSFLHGVSFASGGARIIDGTDQGSPQSIPLTKQVDYYAIVHRQLLRQLGSSAAHKHFSKSLFAVVIGSNDIFGYFGSPDLVKKRTPQQHVDLMVRTLEAQLKRVYQYGGRKFALVDLGPIGCCPKERSKNGTECNEQLNVWARKYNEGLKNMLVKLKSELKEMNYSLFHSYTLIQNFIRNPAAYGFKEIKGACCGLGKLNAKVACLPISNYCSNRKDHLFWDPYHPTEAASSISVRYLFDGSSIFTSPMNVRHLIAL